MEPHFTTLHRECGSLDDPSDPKQSPKVLIIILIMDFYVLFIFYFTLSSSLDSSYFFHSSYIYAFVCFVRALLLMAVDKTVTINRVFSHHGLVANPLQMSCRQNGRLSINPSMQVQGHYFGIQDVVGRECGLQLWLCSGCILM